jgi:isoleucyl-tRNA synthetase
VFLSEFFPLPDAGATAVNWETLTEVRDAVAKALEALRDAGGIGSALEADVVVYADGELRTALEALGDELRFVFITSAARVQPLADAPATAAACESFRVSVTASEHSKCIRCWHRRPDVGSDSAHPEICGRCVGNITGPGEQREYA